MIYDQEINEALDESLKLRVRYSKLYGLLQRVCIAQTSHLTTDFSNLFSRLYFVCKQRGLRLREVDCFRRNALKALRGEIQATEEGLKHDAESLRRFLTELCATTGESKDSIDEPQTPVATTDGIQRGIVTAVGEAFFVLRLQDEEGSVSVETDAETLQMLREGMRVNVIGRRRWIVMEPDFLVDVSALTACVRPYGTTPLNYLLSKFQPRSQSRATLLGNAANQFMDDCIHSEHATFSDSMQTHFRQSLLDYACYERPEEIDAAYFAEAQTHFQNIRQTVHKAYASPEVGISLEKVLLEPAFICPTLGLRGRLDVMTADHRKIVELKSGKADDFRAPVKARSEHLLQMALYKEMLHYNFALPHDVVDAFLLYSRYPVLLADRISQEQLARIFRLRNQIVVQEMLLRDGQANDVLLQLKPENIVTMPGLHPNFLRAVLPPIEAVTKVLQGAQPLERAYFNHFLTFLSREQFLSKMGEPRADSTRGFARVWNADITSKLMSGEILINLRIRELVGEEAVEEIIFEVPNYGEKFIADFSEGEMVQLYERTSPSDGVCTRQLVRGHIVRLTESELCFHLAYKQRNRHFFSKSTFYAIEKDSTDSGYNAAYRGLFALLQAPDERRKLLLGLRSPRFADAYTLVGDYGEYTNKVVRAAMSAEDYYLLVGPPGTGKTNVTLRAMVQEFLASECVNGRSGNLLLTAYTNRAVDEICRMLQTSGIDFVRLGIEQTCDPEVLPNLFSVRTAALRNRQEVANFLQQTSVVVGTIATLASHTELFNVKQFELAIIDEASQVLEPQIMPLLAHPSAIARFIMIGDHKQLPAVVMQRPEQTRVGDERLQSIGLTDLRNSLFERLHRFVIAQGLGTQAVGLLHLHGRMHREIATFVNQYFYGNKLMTVPLPHQEDALNYPAAQTPMETFVASARMGFVHVVPDEVVDNVKANRQEAACVAQIVRALTDLHQRMGVELDVKNKVGIIVPFRNQISMVRARLRECGIADADELTVDTVECYQGSQRDFIIFTTTISRPYQLSILSVLQQVEGIEVDRKLNVAITRARRQFFIVGNRELLSANNLYARLIEQCRQMDFSCCKQ